MCRYQQQRTGTIALAVAAIAFAFAMRDPDSAEPTRRTVLEAADQAFVVLVAASRGCAR